MASSWDKAKRNLPVGRELKDGAYVVADHGETAIVLRRVATGKLVRVTRSLIERTGERMSAGEIIAKRSISYTVAIEFAVVTALGRGIKLVGKEYVGG